MVIKSVAAGTIVAAGIAASGALLVQGLAGAQPSAPMSGEALTCSIYSVPTLDVAPVPQSHLVDGAAYAAVCVDGEEETAFVFLYRPTEAR
jgi:hypothetical protein